MPYLKEQVEIINEILKENLLNDKRFSFGKIYGLAKIVHRSEEEEADQSFPVLFRDGEPIDLSPDDTNHFQMYHRRNGKSSFEIADDSFGDGNDQIETVPMKIIIYGNRDRLKLDSNQFESLLNLALPTEISRSRLKDVKIDNLELVLGGSDLDNEVSVFGEEYNGFAFALQPSDFLFKIEYDLKSQFRKGCFNLCDC